MITAPLTRCPGTRKFKSEEAAAIIINKFRKTGSSPAPCSCGGWHIVITRRDD